MAYSGYASSIDSSKSTLTSDTAQIKEIDFSSVWQGSAFDKQTGDIQKVMDGIHVQVEQLGSLSEAMKLIDDYDNTKTIYDTALNNRNHLDSSDENYGSLYNDYSSTMNDASEKMSDLESQVNQLLNGIGESYSSSISCIPATALESTTDSFVNVQSISSTLSTGFDLSNTVVSVGAGNFNMEPDFSNTAAWISENPYAANYMGQCTWFAWGRFYEIYGYSPGFTGNGYQCVGQLLNAHGDKFYQSDTPVAGSVFSTNGVNRNHVGIIVAVDGDTITVQDGNYDGHNNGWDSAQTDWGTWTTTLSEFQSKMGGGVTFANPK